MVVIAIEIERKKLLLINPFVVDRFWLCQRDKADSVRRELLCKLRQSQWSSCFSFKGVTTFGYLSLCSILLQELLYLVSRVSSKGFSF